MVIAEELRGTAAYNIRHDFSALSEDYLLHITLRPRFIAHILIAVIIGIVEISRIVGDKYLA